MAGRLSFSIAINLLTENFKRGASSVKNALRSMQMQVLTFAAAMGAGGLGLSNFVSRLIDTARETNRVTTALKNVSGSAAQFAGNQRFLLDMAKKYGLEINALTGAYAQFTAAASVSGMSMENQRKVFESVSRATTAFGMSAEDSKGVFLALSQMMSKGKISSEELRLQMGERLPIALQAMAKAAGTSVAGLDKLLKQGKLMSADVLPRFAEALNEMIPNIDTDNLETSINHLKNALTEFTKSTGIGDYYKKLVDKITTVFQGLADKIKNIFVGVLAAIAFFITNAVTKVVRGWGSTLGQMESFSRTANAKALAATEKRVLAEQSMEKAKLQQASVAGAQKIKAAEMVARAEKKLATAVATEVKAQELAKSAAAKASAFSSSSAWGKSFAVMKLGAIKLMVSLRALWNTFAPAVIISAVVALIGYFKNMYDEAKRIKNIFADYKKEIESVGNTHEVVMLEKQLAIMNDKKQKQEDINNAQAALQKALGVETKSQEELNRLVAKRAELLKTNALIEARTRISADAELKKEELKRKRESLVPDRSGYRPFLGNVPIFGNAYKLYNTGKNLYQNYKWEQNEKEIAELDRIIRDNDKALKELTISANGLDSNTPPTTPPDDDTKKTDLQKAQESYAKKLRELEARREVEGMSVSEYNKALDSLNQSALIEARASNDKQILESEHLKNLQKAVDSPNYTAQQKALDEFLSVKNNYEKEAEKLKNQLDNGVITQKNYNEKLTSLAESTLLSAGALSGIGEAGEEFIKALQGIVASNAKKVEKPELKARDKTFDYKKTDLDITREKLDVAKENAEKIREAYNKGAEELETELNNALASVDSLEDALKIAEVQQDIKDLNEQINKGLYAGVKDIAGSADRVVNAFSNLKDVFNDVDSSGWERIMAVWNAITQTVDSFLSILNMIETLTTLTQQLTKAKETEAVIDTAVTATKASNAATGVGTAATEVASSKTVTGAYQAEMAAKTAAAYAYIPYVGPAIAAAQITAMLALIQASSIPMFAKGGIVGGTSTNGDKLLARVNSGEMILTQSQQATLFQLANGKGLNTNSSSGKEVVFRIEGDTLVGVLNNYNRRRRRI